MAELARLAQNETGKPSGYIAENAQRLLWRYLEVALVLFCAGSWLAQNPAPGCGMRDINCRAPRATSMRR